MTFTIKQPSRQGEIEVTPKIGMGVSICYANDHYPATIVKVSESGKTIWLREDRTHHSDDGARKVFSPGEDSENLIKATYREKSNRFRLISDDGNGGYTPYISFSGRGFYQNRDI